MYLFLFGHLIITQFGVLFHFYFPFFLQKLYASLNFYDTDAVKAFVLDILIENAELKSDLDYEKKCSNDWFDRYKKADQQVKDLEAKVATLEGGSENE